MAFPSYCPESVSFPWDWKFRTNSRLMFTLRPSTENWISKVLPLALLGPLVFQTPDPFVSRTLTSVVNPAVAL